MESLSSKYKKHVFICTNQKAAGKSCCGEERGMALVNAFKEQQTQITQQQKQLEQQQIQIEKLKNLICLDHPKADFCQEK